MKDVKQLEMNESMGQGALVWIGLGGKFHLVQWREHNSAQRSWCGKWLQAQLGSWFRLDQREGKGYSDRCAQCERMAR